MSNKQEITRNNQNTLQVVHSFSRRGGAANRIAKSDRANSLQAPGSETLRSYHGYQEICMYHRFDFRHPAATASVSLQNHRSPLEVLILVRS